MRLKHSRGNWVVAILACCWPQHISSFSSSSSLSPSINSCKSIHCFITELVRKNQQEQNAPTTTRVRQQSHPSLCLLWWNLCHQLLSEFWVGLTDGWFWIEYQRHTDTITTRCWTKDGDGLFELSVDSISILISVVLKRDSEIFFLGWCIVNIDGRKCSCHVHPPCETNHELESCVVVNPQKHQKGDKQTCRESKNQQDNETV